MSNRPQPATAQFQMMGGVPATESGTSMAYSIVDSGASRARSLALPGQSLLPRLSSWKTDNARNSIEFEFTGSF